MRYLLYLPGIILILLPFVLTELSNKAEADSQRRKAAERAAAEEQRQIEAAAKKAAQEAKAAERERKQAEREQARAAKEAERQRKQDAAHALKVARAAELAELAERELAARQAAMALDAAKVEPTPEEHSEPVHDAQPDTEPTQPDTEPTKPDSLLSRLGVKGNNAFKGHVVAFTGRLPGMTRAEAIQAVQANGGRAYTKMPAGTTLLVVGDKPGMCKMDKADEWIGQVRKITAKQFFEMLAEPLTVEPEELEAAFAAMYAA